MDTLLRPRPTARADHGAALDRAHLARYTLGDAGLEAEILELFVRQAPSTMARLSGARDARQWREAAHTLKGSARAVGAWRLAASAEACEGIDCLGTPDTVESGLAEVARAFDEVATVIEQICRAAGRDRVREEHVHA